LNDANDQAIDAIIRAMRIAALNACRVFAARHEDNEVRYWGVLNGVEQLNMLETMQAELTGVDPRLVFFENFVRLWPFEFVQFIKDIVPLCSCKMKTQPIYTLSCWKKKKS
jgi:hypothetical protein